MPLPRRLFYLSLALICAGRIAFGLTSEFWFDDELQIYLLGLKSYCMHAYPYYGPDVVYTNTQIAGGLQGLLVAVPLFILPIPESPALFLNVCSIAALFLFCRFLCSHFKTIPAPFIYCWVLTLPWLMNYSTRVINPSYVLPLSVLFFIAFFDTILSGAKKFFHSYMSFFLLGFCPTGIMQLHLSWVLLLPFLVYVCFHILHKQKLRLSLSLCVAFVLGMALGLATLIPTWIQYGAATNNGTTSNIVFNIGNFKNLFTIVTRYLSFASYEIPYMLGGNTHDRLAVVSEWWPMAPFTAFLLVLGFVQVAFLLFCFFLKKKSPQFKIVAQINVVLMFIIFCSFFFSVKGPSSHTFFITIPVVIFYALHCYEWLFQKYPWTQKLMYAAIISSIVFHMGAGLYNYRHKSLYTNRQKVVKAIEEKNYKLLGNRRADDRGYGF